MPRPVAYPWLQAEAHGFPLTSPEAFRLRTTALTRGAVGVLDDGPTQRLAGTFEEHARPRAGGMSLEVLRQLRDAAWFPREATSVPLHRHLDSLAERYLDVRGRRAVLRGDGDTADAAARFRWLSLVLPADLLIASLAARHDFEPCEDTVQLVTAHLAETLKQPCAETHLHAGASVPFGLLWTARMRDVASEAVLADRAGKATPFGGAKPFLSMLLAAATSRLVLAAFLRFRRDLGVNLSFQAFGDQHFLAIASRIPWPLGETDALRSILRALALLRDGPGGRISPLPPERARRLYRMLAGKPLSSKGDAPLLSVARADPLVTWLPARSGVALPETRFAAHALRYLAGPGASDRVFALHFWQYQRVRCQTYRYLVEEPGTAGLDWFTRHQKRISPLRGALESLTYSTSLHVQSADLHLGALEARTSPGSRWVDIRDEAHALAEQAIRFTPAAGKHHPEIGLVLHFIKERERGERLCGGGQRSLMYADPRSLRFGCRFGAWFHERRRQAIAVETALRYCPELLLVLRGVDVANVELFEPTWPLVPLFQRARRASRIAAARLARVRPSWEVKPLQITVHAGEDFRRLVEGLRRVHEPLAFGILETGDRVGHGVALGEDPERWAAAACMSEQPMEDRLDDLLWELERYQRRDISADTGRLEYARAEAVALGREIYGAARSFDLDDLVEARRLRHSPAALAAFGYPFFRERAARGPAALLQAYLSDPGVFARGQRPIEVEADGGEVAMLKAAQRWLRGLFGRREITVEANPSSNLLIADYLDVAEHPVFRMQPLPSMPEPDGGAVLVSINTDNPITFASCLADEMAHVYHALLRRGVPAAEALAWIDRVRSNGYRSRFTLAASAEPHVLREILPARRRSLTRRT